ncbi:Histone H2AX [Lucilia cuprina]|nr:Histone H2AX [Lucilia cuprina]
MFWSWLKSGKVKSNAKSRSNRCLVCNFPNLCLERLVPVPHWLRNAATYNKKDQNYPPRHLQLAIRNDEELNKLLSPWCKQLLKVVTEKIIRGYNYVRNKVRSTHAYRVLSSHLGGSSSSYVYYLRPLLCDVPGVLTTTNKNLSQQQEYMKPSELYNVD